MTYRYPRFAKREKVDSGSLNTMIERLRKIRALNCSPSDVGINNSVIKGSFFNRLNFSSKLY